MQRCSGDCTSAEHGLCVPRDYNGNVVANCSLSDYYCHVACECAENYGGNDCSVDIDVSTAYAEARTQLASDLLATTHIQEADDTTVLSHIGLLEGILRVPNQVTHDTLLTCSAALEVFLTQASGRSTMCTSANYNFLVGALSVLLNSARTAAVAVATEEVHTSIYTSMQLLTENCQDNAAFREDGLGLYATNLRIITGITSVDAFPSQEFVLPQSMYDYYTGSRVPAVSLVNGSASFEQNGFGLSVFELLWHPRV
jgi:hypothetical protein